MTEEHKHLLLLIVTKKARHEDFYKVFPKNTGFSDMAKCMTDASEILEGFGCGINNKNIPVWDGSFNIGDSYALIRRTRNTNGVVKDGYIVEVLG